MPLVDLAKRDFAALVVCLDALDDMHHGLLPLPPSLFGRAFLPGSTLVGWGAAPSSGGRQVAVPHSYAAVSWPRNDCTILLYEGDVYAPAHKVRALRNFGELRTAKFAEFSFHALEGIRQERG
jgi:hypothetical protein